MTNTRFPDGLDVGSEAGAAGAFSIGGTASPFPISHVATAGKKVAAGTVSLPVGGTAFATGLTAVDYATAALYGSVLMGTGLSSVQVSKAGGSVTILGVCAAGTAAFTAGTASWIAVGS